MPHPFSRYRLRLLGDFVRIIVVPSVALKCLCFLTRPRLGLLTVPCYIVFCAVVSYVRNTHAYRVQEREARRVGARLPPQVVGKWPGNLDIMIKMIRASKEAYLAEFYQELFNQYRSTTLNLRLMWSDTIITMDEEHIKFILATGFQHFWRGRRQKERMELFLGDGIFNRDDEQWKAHRNLARPFFSRDRISDFEIFERYTDTTLSIISSLTDAGEPIEVQDLYARFTLDTASEALFGERLDTLHRALPIPGKSTMSAKGSATKDEFGDFVQSFEVAQEIVVRRSGKGYFWPATQLFKDDIEPHADVISKFLEPMISRVLRNKAQMKKAGIVPTVEQSTFLDYLADNTEDPKVIRDQLLNILLAGRDTTSCLLTFVTYFMALHPEIVQKMREEVLKFIGPTRAPTIDDIKELRYMHAVINETLRLFPPVPINQREVRNRPVLFPKSDGTFLEESQAPIYAPANTVVIFFQWFTHRNPTLWGPDADVFDPERWLDDRLRTFTENPMIFTPFSAGPRICIGQNYARNEATFFLVRLLQQFDTFTLAPEVQPEGSLPPPEWKSAAGRKGIEKLRPAYALTLFAKGGLWVRFSKNRDS